mmetsp:Transcript_4995/g.11092  ORF Transcript_4995/g.11092 Transcript_4995/m.11092 type:complete len:129 (+) Transcript_4995:58-444(+)
MAQKSFTFGTFDCLGDIPVCFGVYCCGILCIPTIGAGIETEDFSWGNLCRCVCASYCWPCGCCCCPEHLGPCFMDRLLKAVMAYHKITEYPGPCGEMTCLGCCLCQMNSWFMPCTLCVMLRENKLNGK